MKKIFYAFVALVVVASIVAFFGFIIYSNTKIGTEDLETESFVVESVRVEDGGWLYDDIYWIETIDGDTIKVIDRYLEIVEVEDTTVSRVDRTIVSHIYPYHTENMNRCILYVAGELEFEQ